MYRKFIGITMQHLTNKYYVVSICMTVFLISCSHIAYLVYDEGQILENSDDQMYVEEHSETNSSQETPKYIYCTPEDRKKGIKAIFGDINAPCGLSRIQPLEDRVLEIKHVLLGIEESDSARIPIGHHLLLLKFGNNILQEMKVEKEDDPFWHEVVFVKIRKNIYWQDLNNDGYPEFAVLSRDTGNALYRTVNIYTLKDKSFHFYGKGKYLWEAGEHVLLNCPKCWKFDLDECKKCT